MKKFQFELQDVLEFRNFEKTDAEAELAAALSVENKINDDINAIALQYLQLKNEMKNTSDFEEIISQNQFKKLLDYQKEELLKQLAEAKLVTEEKRKILAEIMKKTIALEKLKEQAAADYKEDVKKLERKQLDEVGTRIGSNI